jgi:replicative DNA helicase
MTQIFLDNPLPSSEDAERVVLGVPFIDEKVFTQIASLAVETFYNPNNRDTFRAMLNLYAENKPINPLTVYEEIKVIDPSTQLTPSEITNLTYGLPHFSNLDSYIAILKDKALKRRLIREFNNITIKAAREEALGVEIIGDAVNRIQDMYSASLDRQKPTVSLSEGLPHNYKRWEKMLRGEIVTIETGIPQIDQRLTGGGVEKGMYHVEGARPGLGKTSLALDTAFHNGSQDRTVVFFTLELSREVLLDRLIAPLAGIERWKINLQWMDERDFQHLIAVSEFIKSLPIFINDRARSTKDMRLALKEVARKTGGEIDLIIVDFLTKMQGTGRSKYESVSENANALSQFASEFNAAVICLAQLSRDITKRQNDIDGGKPRLSDFRDSGEIEELGRTVFGLWGNDDTSGLRDVNISCLKQGEGQTFDEKLIFDTNFMTFGARNNLIQRGDKCEPKMK